VSSVRKYRFFNIDSANFKKYHFIDYKLCNDEDVNRYILLYKVSRFGL